MGPNTPEQNPPEKSMQQQAQETANRIIAEIQASYKNRLDDIKNENNEGERLKMRAQLAEEMKKDWKSRIQEQTEDTGRTGQDEIKKSREAKKIFLEVKYLGDVLGDGGVNVVNKKSQLLVDKIVENIKSGELTDRDILDIERNLGRELINGVVFSEPNGQLSTTEEGLRNLLQVNQKAVSLISRNIDANQGAYGTTAENLMRKINPSEQESQRTLTPEQQTKRESREEDDPFIRDKVQYYQSRFTENQLDLISTFYSPKKFVTYMEQLSNETSDGKVDPEGVRKEKQEIEKKVKEYYEKKNEPKNEAQLKAEVERHWGEKVSEKMNWRVSDVVNQLFLELQSKSPNKFYDEIMQEDMFYGPATIQKRIQAAITSLMTKVDQMEKNTEDPLVKRMKKLNLYRISPQKEASYIEERGKEEEVNKKLYPRVRPFPYGENVDLSLFIKQINQTIDQTIDKAQYFHNARAMYGHPAGEKGFYGQLGGYAESLKGNDIDNIMLLPDGKHVIQAFQLYEKMLEEDFASLDWRHRPDQLSAQLERVSSKIEDEVYNQLRAFYPDLAGERVRNIVNSAVGIARGVFLTEPEKSAYADPVDSEGNGMVASYSTNDAASLNVFNPLHNALRWQGEHNWNMMYFMPVDGQPGRWDHKKAWDNMARYMDSFIVGKGRGEGKNKLAPVFADVMMDINNVGGPNKRKGWRLKYSLDAHFVYDADNTINAPKTFKAMEAIGYEGIFNFVNEKQAGAGLLKATENTAPDQVKERKDLFRYIFKRYFYDGDPANFQESDLDNYLTKLQTKGEENVVKQLKEKGSSSISGSWEEQVAYETSQLFMKNTLAHYVAARMPSKFLRIDRNRFNENGVSRWEKVRREFGAKNWDRAKFDRVMKNMTMAEMLLRRQISEQIREQISLDPKWTLDRIDDKLPYRLTEKNIRELLSKNKMGGTFKSPEEISDVVELFNHIRADFDNEHFLDDEGAAKIKEYTFTFGLEDTDISLIPYRATGPRMIARAIKDTGSIEQSVTQWMLKMPDVMSEIAVNGKHDFSPIIEYLRAAKKAINDVHGSEGAQEFVYKIAGTVINYFKKDTMSKPLFGLLRIGQRNSIAAEYAGRSTAVWEWDSSDIDRFAVALESYRLLPKNAYDLNKTERNKKEGKYIGGDFEDRWIKLPFLKKPIKFNLFGKQRHIDFEYNGARLRKAHGADWKAKTIDTVTQFLPIAMALLLWKYMKDAMDEATGAKKK